MRVIYARRRALLVALILQYLGPAFLHTRPAMPGCISCYACRTTAIDSHRVALRVLPCPPPSPNEPWYVNAFAAGANVVGVTADALVLLSDGVDTSSKNLTSADMLQEIGGSDTLIYPIKYDTYDDVQRNRKENAQVLYDDNDRPYTVEKPPQKGEREEDYRNASEFLKKLAVQTGGSLYRVSSTTNLNKAFAKIADELRKIYSLGYYSGNPRQTGVRYAVNVRVYRPNLKIRAKESYVWRKSSDNSR